MVEVFKGGTLERMIGDSCSYCRFDTDNWGRRGECEETGWDDSSVDFHALFNRTLIPATTFLGPSTKTVGKLGLTTRDWWRWLESADSLAPSGCC